ncbi:MAG: MFS transporter [Salinibacter sp.]|uniref:MFS transporter n=1 Tax=Salinibacter sp. TaxID=2065818 RepID=UPI0035D411BA
MSSSPGCMTLAQSPRLRLVTFSALYLVQGIPTGFITITLAALLAEQGYSAGAVAALMTINYVPWGIKVLYGPWLDRHSHSAMGRRRPWILVAQCGMLVSLGVLLAVPGVQGVGLVPIALIIFVYNLFGALQDVATDALAVDLLDPDERGFVSGAMWSSKIGGIAIGGAGMSMVLNQFGWRPAIAVQLVLLLIAVGFPLLLRERASDRYWAPSATNATSPADPTDAAAHESIRDVVARLVDTFRRPVASILALLALLAAVPTRMMVTYGPVFTVQQLGWTDTGYSQFAGGPALLAGAAGAVLGGWLADRLGRRRMVAAAAVGIIATFLAFATTRPWWSVSGLVVAFLLAGMFFDMTLRMSLQAIYMTTTRDAVAATQFTIYMTLGNMSNVVGSALITPLDALLEARSIFLCAAVLGVVPLVLLRWLPPIPTPDEKPTDRPSLTDAS